MKPPFKFHGYHLYQPSAWISAEGEDAHDFLQSQFSNDLSNLEIGQSVYGLWLDLKGKVKGDSFVFRSAEEKFQLLSYATPESLILEKLNSFIVADDVELAGQAEDVSAVSLVGDAVSLAEVLGMRVGQSGISTVDGEIVIAFPGRRGAQPAVELVTVKINRDALLKKLFGRNSLFTELDELAMKASRITGRCPLIPLDIGPGELPQEAGLESEAVSFTKGCYLGQEVMSRLHSMGQVRRSLRLAQASRSVEFDSPVYLGEKKVGNVKTSVRFENTYFVLIMVSNVVADKECSTTGSSGEAVSLTLLP